MESKIFSPLSENELREQTDSLLNTLKKFAIQLGLDWQQVNVVRPYLPLILQRVEKRRQYFRYFHEGMEINEIKQAALVAYWVLKFRPFSYCYDNTSGLSALELDEKYKALNERLAFLYIVSACRENAKIREFERKELSDGLVSEIIYAFKYWDLSKEAVILIAEVLGEAFYGIVTKATSET